MLLLYFICSLWGCPSFSCKRSPPFLYLFYPTNIFYVKENQLFLYFFFLSLVVNLIVSLRSLKDFILLFVCYLFMHR